MKFIIFSTKYIADIYFCPKHCNKRKTSLTIKFYTYLKRFLINNLRKIILQQQENTAPELIV